MAKKDNGPGCLTYFLFIAALAILAICFFISNTFDFKTLLTYGPSQYLANIVHFHRDYYCRAESALQIYENIMPAGVMDGTEAKKPIAIIQPGGVFKLKGYRTKEYVTWVAAKIAKGPNIVYGYFMVPEKIGIPAFWAALNRIGEMYFDSAAETFKNKYFSQIPADSTEEYRSEFRDLLKSKLRDAVKLETATEPIEMQRIKESEEFEIIDGISSDATIYYCPKADYRKAEDLYEAYLGDGFDVHYLQISRDYDPSANAGIREGLILRIIDTWYFKLSVAIALILVLKFLRRRST